MATKGKQTVKATDVVQLALLPKHVDAVEAKVLEVGNAFTDLFRLLHDGYNLTFSYEPDKQTYTARLAGVTQYMIHNEGKLLYANGETPELAVACLWVKHFLVAMGKEWTSESVVSRKFS